MTGPQDVFDALSNERRDLFSRAVALCAVITTLVAAVVAFLHADASREGDRAAAASQRAAIEAAHSVVRGRQTAQIELRQVQLAREHRTRQFNADQRELLGLEGDGVTVIEAAHWRRLAGRAEREIHQSADELHIADAGPGSVASPERDQYFPSRLLAQTEHRGRWLAAVRDAHNELSSEWGKRGTVFIAILTLLAVALYLFGFSLTPQGRHMRGVFATFGGAFLLIGVLFGPMQAFFPPQVPPAAAAEHYADGWLAVQTAEHSEDYAQAVEHYDDALRLRPGFARAYFERSNALTAAASPQTTSFLSLAPAPVRKAAIRDLKRARELGLDTPAVTGNLGFELLALGLQTGSSDRIEESLDLTRTAIDGDPREPVLRFNLGATLLAAGRTAEAWEAYRTALRTMIGQSESHSRMVAARALSFEGGWASGALTDLEMVARYRGPGLLDDVRRIKELIVGSREEHRVVKPRSDGFLDEVKLTVAPGYLQIDVRGGKELQLDRASLETQWYRREPGLGWSHLEMVSGPCVPAGWSDCQLVEKEDGWYFAFVTYPDHSYPPACLLPGDYRVELYEKGRLVGEAHATSTRETMVGFTDKDAGVVGCRPQRWKRSSLGREFVRGYTSDDGSAGLYVTRLNNLMAPGFWDSRVGTGAASSLVKEIEPLIGRTPRLAGTESFDFMEFDPLTQKVLRYRYPGGHLMVGAAQDDDGSIVVGLAFAPSGAFGTKRLAGMLAALSASYTTPSAFQASPQPAPELPATGELG